MYYTNGAVCGHVNRWRVSEGSKPRDDLSYWLRNPQAPEARAVAGMAAGFALTHLLTALRARLIGFPLHPAAYVLNTSFASASLFSVGPRGADQRPRFAEAHLPADA